MSAFTIDPTSLSAGSTSTTDTATSSPDTAAAGALGAARAETVTSDRSTVRTRHVSAYADLSARVRAIGLLQRRRSYYWWHGMSLVGVLVALGVAFVLLGDSWLQLVVAGVLGVVMCQFGFLGHDAAHRQVFGSASSNEWAARVVSTVFVGLSYGWWTHKHNKHHSGPNQEDRDPDISSGVLAFTPRVAATRTGFAAWFARRQGFFFFPLLLLEGLNLHVAGIRTLIERRDLPHRRLEGALITLRLGGYLTVLFVMLSPAIATSFLAVQLGLFGLLLGGSFAPNHKGMPVVPKNMKIDFLRRQVVMSRNIRGGWLTDLAMGGLNYQIEHHLFPSMARPNLRRAQPIVKAFCREQGIPYTETSLIQSYGIVVRYLNAVGLRARDPFECPLVREYRG